MKKTNIFMIILSTFLICSVLFNLWLFVRGKRNKVVTNLEIKGDIDLPSELLYKIYLLDMNGDYDSIRKYVYNIAVPQGEGELKNSADKIVDGIREKYTLSRSFAYTRNSVLFHAKRIDSRIKSGDIDLLNKYIKGYGLLSYDSKIKHVFEQEPERFLFYENDPTALVFLKSDAGLKLLITLNLDIAKEND